MRVEKQGAPFGQAIDVRRVNLWMSVHATDPVIKVINRDKKQAWPLYFGP